jgi:hypothetical protein
MKTKRITAVCLFAACLFLSFLPAAFASDASTCVAGRSAAPVGFWTWPSNTRVNIYLREPDFSAAEVPAVRIAVANWDLAGRANGSNVQFTFHGLTRETRTAGADLTIVRGNIYDPKVRHLALLEAHSLRDDQLIDYALVIVDVTVDNNEVLTNVIAHELGHSLGLLDCHKCKGQSTAMGLLKTAHDPNGIDGPTVCDTNAVRLAYHELKQHARPAPQVLAQARAKPNSGSEPEVDLTPIVP